MGAKVYTYIPSRERLSREKRSAIARNAALARARQRREAPRQCKCGHMETEHWSLGARECRTCYDLETLDPCAGFSARVK